MERVVNHILQVNVVGLVPPMMIFMTKSPLVKNYDVSSLEHILCGAAPVASTIIKEFWDIFPVKHIQQGQMDSITDLLIIHC